MLIFGDDAKAHLGDDVSNNDDEAGYVLDVTTYQGDSSADYVHRTQTAALEQKQRGSALRSTQFFALSAPPPRYSLCSKT